jgi:D-serine dehydratase
LGQGWSGLTQTQELQNIANFPAGLGGGEPAGVLFGLELVGDDDSLQHPERGQSPALFIEAGGGSAAA